MKTEPTGCGNNLVKIILIILAIVVLLALNNYVEQKRVKRNELKKEVLSELEKTKIPDPLEANTKQGLDSKYEFNNKIAIELLRKAQIYSDDTEIKKASKRWIEYKENLEKDYKVLSAKIEFDGIPDPEPENNIKFNTDSDEALAKSYIQKKESAEKYLQQLNELSKYLYSTDKKEEFEKKNDGWLKYKNILVVKLKDVLAIDNPPTDSIFNNIDSSKIEEIYKNEIVQANSEIKKIQRFLQLIPNDEDFKNRLDLWKKYNDEEIHNYYENARKNIDLKTSYEQIPNPPEVYNIDSSSEDNLISSYIVEEQNIQSRLEELQNFAKENDYDCNNKINDWKTYKVNLDKRLKESLNQLLEDAPSYGVNISGTNDISSLRNKLLKEIERANIQIAKANSFLQLLKGDNDIASRKKDWENYISRIQNSSYNCPNHKPICPNCSTSDGKIVCPVCNSKYNSGWGWDYCDYCDDADEHGSWGNGYNYCKNHQPKCNACGTKDGKNVLSLYE